MSDQAKAPPLTVSQVGTVLSKRIMSLLHDECGDRLAFVLIVTDGDQMSTGSTPWIGEPLKDKSKEARRVKDIDRLLQLVRARLVSGDGQLLDVE